MSRESRQGRIDRLAVLKATKTRKPYPERIGIVSRIAREVRTERPELNRRTRRKMARAFLSQM